MKKWRSDFTFFKTSLGQHIFYLDNAATTLLSVGLIAVSFLSFSTVFAAREGRNSCFDRLLRQAKKGAIVVGEIVIKEEVAGIGGVCLGAEIGVALSGAVGIEGFAALGILGGAELVMGAIAIGAADIAREIVRQNTIELVARQARETEEAK